MGNELVKPAFETSFYRPRYVVRIVDRYEQFLFIKHGAFQVDMYENNDNLVMIFRKEDTKELYELYRQYKLK
jgi:hypothetical protein